MAGRSWDGQGGGSVSFDTGGGGDFLSSLVSASMGYAGVEKKAAADMYIAELSVEAQRDIAKMQQEVQLKELGIKQEQTTGDLANTSRGLDIQQLLGLGGLGQQQYATEMTGRGDDLANARGMQGDLLSYLMGNYQSQSAADASRFGSEAQMYGADKASQSNNLGSLLSYLGLGVTGDTQRDVANIGAGAQLGVAGINAGSARDVANINTQPGLMRENRIGNNANVIVPMLGDIFGKIFGAKAGNYVPLTVNAAQTFGGMAPSTPKPDDGRAKLWDDWNQKNPGWNTPRTPPKPQDEWTPAGMPTPSPPKTTYQSPGFSLLPSLINAGLGQAPARPTLTPSPAPMAPPPMYQPPPRPQPPSLTTQEPALAPTVISDGNKKYAYKPGYDPNAKKRTPIRPL